ncbi:hypothetical protein KR200_007360 [Drosophila serrata]|nr:hypothetical protein KR200_007360 [Drosophila serrata]
MAHFQIYEDKDNNKENSTVNVLTRGKNTKQPLGLLNTNKINQKNNAKPFGELVEIHKFAAKKSNELLPVIEQLESISLPQDEVDSIPMSVDRSSTEVFSSQVIQKKATRVSSAYDEVHYQKDILVNCRVGELKNRPQPLYMVRQKDICHKMRSVLIDWLVEVTVDYEMNSETLYLCISFIDRFLSQVAVKRSVLQLVGTTALFIACKFEEMTPPQVEELIYITDDSYTREEILNMERFMLKILSFNLVTPTAYAFVKMYAVMCDEMCETLKSLAMYISELSLLKGDPFLLYLPSMISSAALALARHILGMEIWSPQLEQITTYKLKDLRTVVLALSSNHRSAKGLKLQGIQKKYKGKQYGNVAEIDDLELTQDRFDLLSVAYEAKHSTRI